MFIQQVWPGVQPTDEVETDRVEKVVGEQQPKEVKTQVKKLVAFAKNTLIHPTLAEMMDLAEERDFECQNFESPENGGWGRQALAHAAMQIMELSKVRDPKGRISFNDMVWLPCAMNWTRAWYDLVVIDEAQDMNLPQLTMAKAACKPGGRICVVGDDRQCQPTGTMIHGAASPAVPIEQIQVGDKVTTFDRHSGSILQNGVVTATAQRRYSGDLFTVAAGNHASRCTDSHKWLVRWTNRTSEAWATYLMRQGDRYRIGQCRLFRKLPSSSDALNFGLGERARVERADAAWILAVHPTLADALAHEQIVSTRYGNHQQSLLRTR